MGLGPTMRRAVGNLQFQTPVTARRQQHSCSESECEHRQQQQQQLRPCDIEARNGQNGQASTPTVWGLFVKQPKVLFPTPTRTGYQLEEEEEEEEAGVEVGNRKEEEGIDIELSTRDTAELRNRLQKSPSISRIVHNRQKKAQLLQLQQQ
ncbi:hypothetical protein ACLKA7_015719 [Drosophila subpalustris]